MNENPPFLGSGTSRLLLILCAAFASLGRVASQSDTCQLVCCLECFCCGPGTAWSADVNLCVPDPSSSTGDDDGSCGEMDPNVCYERPTCTEGNCCGEGTVVDTDLGFPDFGERCQCYGEVDIQEEPTLQPTTQEPTSSPTVAVSKSPFYGPEPSSSPKSQPTSQPSPAPGCSIFLLGHTSCILVDKRRRQFAALVFPFTEGGTYDWSTLPSAEANRRIKIFGGGPTVLVEGVKVSEDADDTTLKVEYTSPAGKKCSDSVVFTVVGYEVRFRDGSKEEEDELDDDNRLKKACAEATGQAKAICDGLGIPHLGHIKHGDPARSTSWAKNAEIRYKLTPCKEDALKKCEFDITRERQGRAGTISDKNKFTPVASLDCPNPKWCNDDTTNTDEDLAPDDPPKCTVFSFDSPGLGVEADNSCDPENEILINQLNFREWLKVGGELPRAAEARGDYLLWHASIRIRCEKADAGLRHSEDAGGPGNRLGAGKYGGNMEDLGMGVTESLNEEGGLGTKSLSVDWNRVVDRNPVLK